MSAEDGGELVKGDRRTGEVEVEFEEEQRSFLATGGAVEVDDVGNSSKKDLFPHTIADIVCQNQLNSNKHRSAGPEN